MKKIHCTKPCPFNFFNWQLQNVDKIFAGHGCVMALTSQGKVLQQVLDRELAADTRCWNSIKSISISRCFPALAVGLTEEGACVISKNALKHACDCTGMNATKIQNELQSLNRITEILVSDSIFALDCCGKVHCIPLTAGDDYKEVTSWSDVQHLAVGSQNSVFGITKNGTVLCAGSNLKGAKQHLEQLQGVVDVCAMGGECETVLLALSDGRVVDLSEKDQGITHVGAFPVFQSNFLLTAVNLGENKVKCLAYNYMEGLEEIEKAEIHSLAIGTDENLFPAFAVWN